MTKIAVPMTIALTLTCIGALAASTPPDDAPMVVEYKLTHTGSGRVVVEGRMPLQTHGKAHFQRRAATGPESTTLAFQVRPGVGGQVAMEFELGETAADGARLEWKPSLLLQRGEPGAARVAWVDDGRTLSVTVR